jgi:hypothetical protein
MFPDTQPHTAQLLRDSREDLCGNEKQSIDVSAANEVLWQGNAAEQRRELRQNIAYKEARGSQKDQQR